MNYEEWSQRVLEEQSARVSEDRVIRDQQVQDTPPGLSSLRTAPTLSPVTDPVSREEIDAKLAAAEARTETRFVQLGADIRTLTDAIKGENGLLRQLQEIRTDNKNTRAVVAVTVIGSAIAIIASVVGMVQVSLAQQANMLSAFQAALAR